jgi:acetyl esterase/lipase
MTVSRPQHDPELAAALDKFLAAMPAGTMNHETAVAMRDPAGMPVPELGEEELAAAGIVREDVTVPGYDGAELPATVLYRADHTAAGPGIYHVHGGGMVTGHRLSGVSQCLGWVVEHDAVLVTVDYRLAPEFPDPYPVEDAYAGLVWTAGNADRYGIDPGQVVIVGASAGGGIAAGTALLARDRRGPALAGQVLVCPMIDDRNTTTSSLQFTDDTLWTRDSNIYGWTSLLGERVGTDDVSVYAAPARATDLAGLPPTYIDCGSAEVFRDEDVAYASALWAAGVDAELHVWAGGFHGFDMVVEHAQVSRAAVAARNSWVARHIGDR